MGDYFGESWPSVVCEQGTRVATPVGELCWWCETTIGPKDQGYWIGGTRLPGHRECNLRTVMGGAAHWQRRCRCYGGPDLDEPDDPAARRADAVFVWNLIVFGEFTRENLQGHP